jgi:hypothetical protein
MAFPPAFCTSVRGMTSSASATALKGPASTPVTARARACRPTEMAISTAPPPGTSVGLKTTLRATDMASARLRSISFRMSLDGPRRRMVHAFGVEHSVRKVKYLWEGREELWLATSVKRKKNGFYSSPIFSTLNSPHRVPMSDSRRSSTRFTIVPPTARAIRLLSDLRTRRSAETFALAKKYCA